MSSGVAQTPVPLQTYALPFGEVCYGCGANNSHGMRIQSFWEGDEAVCTWTPKEHHMAAPGLLNGGVIATLIDCHGACAAMAAVYKAEGRAPGSSPRIIMVTGSLHVDYLKPTPLAAPVKLRAWITAQTSRKVEVECSVSSGGVETARGRVVMVRKQET